MIWYVAEAEEDVVEQTRLGELPMLSLKHVPLEMLSTGMSKLGRPTKH